MGAVVSGVSVESSSAGPCCPDGITIGCCDGGVFLLSPPFAAFITLLGGQLMSVGGQTVFSPADDEPKSLLLPPIWVTSLVLLLLLLLSAQAMPGETEASTTAPAATAARMRMLTG